MIDHQAKPRVALAHDWLVGLRGGEFVLDRLARQFGPTELYTLVSNGVSLTDAISACRVTPSPLQRLPGAAGRLRRHYLPLMPWAVGRLKVAPCDVLISTSSAVMKSIRPPKGTPHLCYCHSPARYIWAQTEEYASGSGGLLRKLGLELIGPAFRSWDRRTADRVTTFLANSRHTAQRIEKYFRREAQVVYPPVRTDWFTPDETIQREDWLLVVSALEPYKRTDLVVLAASQASLKLKVAGDGSQRSALTAMAGPTVEMLGRVDDDALRDLYRRAKALVFPQIEDFGIIPVEAQATGCPVIAFAGGGALETVTPQTGLFFVQHSVDALLEAIAAFDQAAIDPAVCRVNAERFNEQVFDEAIRAAVDDLLSR